jgi:hypothetical protein
MFYRANLPEGMVTNETHTEVDREVTGNEVRR